jgi:membrane protein YdbS with pleckstrin-like domain
LASEPVPQITDSIPDPATINESLPVPVPASSPVEISDQFYSLDPRNIQAERISGFIFSAFVLSGGVIGLMVLWANIGTNTTFIGVALLATLICVLAFVGSWFWPPLEHRRASWRLDSEGLEIRRGVLWRHQITIPLGRVQHADVSQGPLQRQFEIGTLMVHTAGTQNASVALEGLAHWTALELRDQIVRQRTDQHVV